MKFCRYIVGGNFFFGGSVDFYRHPEVKRGGDMRVINISIVKLQSFKVAHRLLTPCSYVALLNIYGIV